MRRKAVLSIIRVLTILMLLLLSGCGGAIRKKQYSKSEVQSITSQKHDEAVESKNTDELSDEELLALPNGEGDIQLDFIDEDELNQLDNLEELIIETDPLSDISTNFLIK